MRLALVTAPVKLALDWSAEVKGHLRQDSEDEAARVTGVAIPAAVAWVEKFTNRAMVTQTWKLYLDRFPVAGVPIDLPKPPLQSVTHVKYYDGSDVQQTWSASTGYEVDPAIPGTFVCADDCPPSKIWPKYGQGYPSTSGRRNAVEIQFVCGYGSSYTNVPGALRAAMLLLVGEMFERREQAIVGTITSKAEFAAENLAWPYRVNLLGGPEPCDRPAYADPSCYVRLA